jgi:hypothetical protein
MLNVFKSFNSLDVIFSYPLSLSFSSYNSLFPSLIVSLSTVLCCIVLFVHSFIHSFVFVCFSEENIRKSYLFSALRHNDSYLRVNFESLIIHELKGMYGDACLRSQNRQVELFFSNSIIFFLYKKTILDHNILLLKSWWKSFFLINICIDPYYQCSRKLQ